MNPYHRSDNPFPGLRSFTQEEDHLFFGREEQTMELLQTLATHRFVAVVGTSGSGKSSLVRCGLLSNLLGGKMLQGGTMWQVAVMHPGAAPFEQLAASLLEADVYDPEEEDASARLMATLHRSHVGLVETIRQARLGDGVNFLLVVDQFEEIFRFNQGGGAQREAANEFVSMLLHAASQKDQPIYIVLTMRSDFIGDCAQFEDLAEAVNRGEYLIPRMTRDQFKQSIEGPIRVAGGSITPRLLQRVLNDLGEQADQLPCLQHALMRTWDHWKRSSHDPREPEGRSAPVAARALDLEDYDAIGRMSEALSRHADELYEGLASEAQRRLCERMFRALTVRESENRGIRRPLRLDRLARTVAVPVAELTPIIDTFRQPGVTFLMPPAGVPLADDTVIDISHESLMRVWVRLREWVEEEAQSVGIFHRLAESAALHEVGKAGLYRDPELGIALAWRHEAHPNAAWADQYGGGFDRAMAYLDLSRVEAEREELEREAARQRELAQAKEIAENQRLRAEEKSRSARRMRGLMRAAMAVAVVALIAMVFAGMAKREAMKSADLALAAEDRVTDELYRADMIRAGQAYEEGNRDWLEDLLDRYDPEIEWTNTVKDLRGPEWYYWRHAARRDLAATRFFPGPLRHLEVAPDQKTVAVEAWPGYIQICEVATGQALRRFPVPRADGDKSSALNDSARISYAPNGTLLAMSGPDGRVRLLDCETWRRAQDDLFIPAHCTNGLAAGQAPQVAALEYSPDGSRLAAGTGNGYVVLWDTRTWEVSAVFDPVAEGRDNREAGRLEFSPDSRLLVGSIRHEGNKGGRLLVWELASKRLVLDEALYPRSDIPALSFSPDGKVMVTGADNGEIRLWHVGTGNGPALVPEPAGFWQSGDTIWRVRFSPTGDYLAASTEAGNAILVFKVESGKRDSSAGYSLYSTLKGHTRPCVVEFVGDDNTLISASIDVSLRLWDVRASGNYAEIPDSKEAGGLGCVTGGRIAWRQAGDSSIGNSIWLRKTSVESDPSPIQLYEVDTVKVLPPWQNGELFTVHATSANGRFLAAQGTDRRMRLWNLADDTLVGTTAGPANPAGEITAHLVVADDGKRVAWCAGEKTTGTFTLHALHTWDPSSENSGRLPIKDGRWCLNLAISPQGDRVAGTYFTLNQAGGRSSLVTVWEVKDTGPSELWNIDPPTTLSLAFSPDGRRLAAGLWRTDLQVYNAANGAELGNPLQGHANAVLRVGYYPDGKSLVSISADSTVRLWDAGTGDRRTTIKLGGSTPLGLSIEPEGRWMAVSPLEENVRIFHFPKERDPRRNAKIYGEEGFRPGLRGDFQRAGRAARRCIELAPYAEDGIPWLAAAAAAIHAKDLEGYRDVRSRMLETFRDKPYVVAGVFTAEVCGALPTSPDEIQTAKLLAARAIEAGAGTAIEKYARAVSGLLEYRSGNSREAIRILETTKEDLSGSVWKLLTYSALALAHTQLDQVEPARQSLEQARKLVAANDTIIIGTPEHDGTIDWTFWIIAKAVFAEAEAQIEGRK